MYDAANIANKDLNGTARFVSMGGAMGALGGDISLSLIHICLKAHQAFESVEAVLTRNADIVSETDRFDVAERRRMVSDTCLLYTSRCV